MRLLKRLLPYALAGSIFFSSGHATAGYEKKFKIINRIDKIELIGKKKTKTNPLESIIRDSFWGKEVVLTNRNVPILMYHDISYSSEYSPRYRVTPDMLREQIRLMHKNNFVPISLSEYVNAEYKFLQKGKKPVVITFDDATIGQFKYINDKTKGRYVDPDCAFEILRQFNEKHPDFRLKATFFIDFVDKNGNFQVPFAQPGYEIIKINNIINLGMEIGNHSLEHINMKKSKSRMNNNNLKFLDYIMSLIKPNYNVEFFAYPYGAVPKEKDKTIENNFKYSCIAWGGVAPDINSKRFDRFRIPRIEINNDLKNLSDYVINKN